MIMMMILMIMMMMLNDHWSMMTIPPGRFPSGAFSVQPFALALDAFRFQSPENHEDGYRQKDDTDELLMNILMMTMVTHSSLEVWAEMVKGFETLLDPEGFRILAEKLSQIHLS